MGIVSTLSERLREIVATDPLKAEPLPRVALYRIMDEAAETIDALAAEAVAVAVAVVRHAVDNPGPRPDVHREIMARHRAEWPTLWDAIDWLIR